MSPLPVEPAHRLADRPDEQRWLVAGLWAEEAVGIIGGEPKCCKSFLALDLAVAVAAGMSCLRRFPVPKPGRVLLYAAEDALHIVSRRLDGHRRRRRRQSRPISTFRSSPPPACGSTSRPIAPASPAPGNIRAGQALRGSSEFHAWGDSNLYSGRFPFAPSGLRSCTTYTQRPAAAPAITHQGQ